MFVTAQKRRLDILKNTSILAYSAILISTAIYQYMMNNSYEKESQRVLAAVERNEQATDSLTEYLDALAVGQTTLAKTYCDSYKKITQKIYKQQYDCFSPDFRR